MSPSPNDYADDDIAANRSMSFHISHSSFLLQGTSQSQVIILVLIMGLRVLMIRLMVLVMRILVLMIRLTVLIMGMAEC